MAKKAKKKVTKKASKSTSSGIKRGQSLVIVESPTKAKTIRKFLPPQYKVEACVGHIRDLPASAKEIPAKYKGEKWAQLGIRVDQDFEPLYVIPSGKTKIIRELKKLLDGSDELILATDEDREGESISNHLVEVLKPQVPIKRMVFHEITKEAIQSALQNFREIDTKLVQAQETRRILDRLVGYSLSPLVWKKIAFGLSVGRVQSVAVKMIVEREMERLRFKKGVYCGLQAELSPADKQKKEILESRCVRVDGKRIATGKDFDESTGQIASGKEVVLLDKKSADQLHSELQKEKWVVKEVTEKPVSRKPTAPFITSTLQQEANRKLGLSSRDAMRVAQSLYQQGFITYMRTDSASLSKEAIQSARRQVERLYGKDYLSPEPRQFKSKSKSAQEAHEAIRPAGTSFQTPEETGLKGKEKELYELIWKRTMASQMAEAKQLSVSVTLDVGKAEFQANGMRMLFPGFLRAYVEGKDDVEAALEEREVLLPDVKVGEELRLLDSKVSEHETKPPARFTEAALVQKLEAEGVGRPSTYASIISTIVDRGYVRRLNNSMVPTFTALAVSKLMEKHFPELVDYQFTAQLEETLDKIATGEKNYLDFLRSFYLDKKEGLQKRIELREPKIDPEEARAVRMDKFPDIEFRIGRFGPYLAMKNEGDDEAVRASIPEDIAPADLDQKMIDELVEMKKEGPPVLGVDPESGKNVYLMTGRYGPYFQLGEIEEIPEEAEEEVAEETAPASGKKKKKKTKKKKKKKKKKKAIKKPRRAMLPKGEDPRQMPLKDILGYLYLPRTLGEDGEGHSVKAGMGRFGPFVVKTGGGLEKPEYRSLKKDDHVLEVDLKRALEIFAEPRTGRGRRRSAPLKTLGDHPEENKPIELYDGPYGHYVKCGKTNASLPEDKKPEEVTLKEAIELIDARKSA